MPFEPARAKGYAPPMPEIMKDLGISSPDEFRPTVLGRCKKLYRAAKRNGNLRRFNESPYEFIICDSGKFYKTLVNMGFGNMALTILDDLSTEVFFLLFKDKLPEKFYPVAAVHETTEYKAVKSGLEQIIAHEKATVEEIKITQKLGLMKSYLSFLKNHYSQKYDELKNTGCLS